MSEFSFAIEGLDKLAERLNGAMGRARKAALAETYTFAEEVMAASKPICPIDTGTLRSSGHVEVPELDITSGGDEEQWSMEPVSVPDNQIIVRLGYGGPARGYAIYVHENLNERRFDPETFMYRKPIHWNAPGTGPKYLENPLKEKQDQLPGRVLDAFKSAI